MSTPWSGEVKSEGDVGNDVHYDGVDYQVICIESGVNHTKDTTVAGNIAIEPMPLEIEG